MKKINFIIILCGLLFTQKSLAQYPVSFPDGVIVGGATTTIPAGSGYKLAVSGGILTEKVRVATSGTAFWADYVFDKSFKLKSLKEVENFIKENKHLPDVPSTTDVTKNGIDLAETQALLLQKIEELTLYVIQQQKEIDKLKKGNRKKK
jgi:hypothetical protein